MHRQLAALFVTDGLNFYDVMVKVNIVENSKIAHT
jgi:hypothetical protein